MHQKLITYSNYIIKLIVLLLKCYTYITLYIDNNTIYNIIINSCNIMCLLLLYYSILY